MNECNLRPTLEQLEGIVWDPPEFDSHLVQTCHELRKKPISEFTIEDLRIMIGQNVGLQHLMPRALQTLESDPFAEGDYYPGDLLIAVAGADPQFFAANSAIAIRVAALCERALSEFSDANLDEELRRGCAQFLESGRIS